MFGPLIFKNNNIFLATDSGVFLSTDNGENWIPKNNGIHLTKTLHFDISTFIIHGDNIFVPATGGIYKSTDNGDNWIPTKNNGLTDHYGNGVNISSLSICGNNFFVGTGYDGIFLSTDRVIIGYERVMDYLMIQVRLNIFHGLAQLLLVEIIFLQVLVLEFLFLLIMG